MSIVQHDYHWNDPLPTCANNYVLPALRKSIQSICSNGPIKILDIGCGNRQAAKRTRESDLTWSGAHGVVVSTADQTKRIQAGTAIEGEAPAG